MFKIKIFWCKEKYRIDSIFKLQINLLQIKKYLKDK